MENISISDAVVLKVNEIIAEDNIEGKLRIFVQGGGCSGFQYGFTFDDEMADDDSVIVKTVGDLRLEILVDPISFQYLNGASIEYTEDLNGSQFVIKNPNAKTTCGCGSSFEV